MGIADDIVQGAVSARVNVDIGHALDGHAVEGGGAVGAAGTIKNMFAGFGIGFFHHLATSDGTDKDAFVDQQVILGGDAIVIKAETARAVGFEGIRAGGQFFGAVAEITKIFQADK